MNIRRNPRRAAVLPVLAVLASICFVGFALVGFAIYRTVTVGGDLRAARNAVLEDTNLRFTHKVEVTAHPLLVGLARFGLSFAPLEPEAQLAIQSIRGAEVGVYELTAHLSDDQRQALFQKVDQRLEKRGWARTVAVFDRDEMVMVYTPDQEIAPDKVEVFVLVLDGRELVLVSGKGNLEPIVELVNNKMREHGPGPLFAQWRD